jgi:hypothetical protein
MTTSHDAGIQLRWRYVAAGRTARLGRGVSQLTGRGAGVFASTDDGSSWNPRNTGLIDFTITAVYRMGKFTS